MGFPDSPGFVWIILVAPPGDGRGIFRMPKALILPEWLPLISAFPDNVSGIASASCRMLF